MKKDKIIMTGKTSDSHSSFAVFETLKCWMGLRETKVIPDGVYFAVVTLLNHKRADIRPDLFVQGYRPHSSGRVIGSDQRRYGAFVRYPQRPVLDDDIQFCEAQLYQIKTENEVELILKDGESKDKAKITELANRICQEQGYEQLSDVKQYYYNCPVSAGYFLALRTYFVWSMLIGKSNGFSLEKKVLLFDYETGIPAVVKYDDRHFEKAEG